MRTEPKAEDSQPTVDVQQEGSSAATGLGGKIEEQYRRIKEHAETYPYVWGSYILVYGGFGLWLTYRWRKLRRTEDRVRTLQERLRKLVEKENATNSAAVPEKSQSAKSASLTDKPPAALLSAALNCRPELIAKTLCSVLLNLFTLLSAQEMEGNHIVQVIENFKKWSQKTAQVDEMENTKKLEKAMLHTGYSSRN